jgi:hypothetical protein
MIEQSADARQGDPSPERGQIGVALSGGGHRSAAFALGALLYLTDAGVSRHVATVSSVSGGSLLNASIALAERPFNRLSAQEFDKQAAAIASCIAGNPRRWSATVGWAGAIVAASVAPWLAGIHAAITLAAAGIGLMIVGLARGPASGGFLFGCWLTWTYLAVLTWGALVALIWIFERPALISSVGQLGWAAGLGGLLVAWGTVAQQRHTVAGLAYGRALSALSGSRGGPSTPLEDMAADGIRHVICATELHAGQHAYFSHDVVYSRGFGVGAAGALPVRTAVQASANFPGGFPARIISAARFGFELAEPKEIRWKHEVFLGGPRYLAPRWMVLADGGIFDNTADAWFLDSAARNVRLQHEFDKLLYKELKVWRQETKARLGLDDFGITKRFDLPQYHPAFRDPFDRRHEPLLRRVSAACNAPNSLLVINGGTPEPWQSLRLLWAPLVGELAGISKVTSSMYNNVTQSALRDLRARFLNGDPHGAVVDIDEDPLSRASEASARHAEGSPRDHVERSWAAWEYLEGKLAWSEPTPELDLIRNLHQLSGAVPTTLRPLGIDVTAELLYHGYLQAMVSLHVALGYPLMHPRPAIEDFRHLASGGSRLELPTPVGTQGAPNGTLDT